MKKDTLINIINILIIILVIIISCIVISNNVIKSLQGKQYIMVNEENRKNIENLISQYKEIKGNLIKVEYMQELGDWSLLLYYDDGKVDRRSFGDSQAYEIKQYIRDNGNDEGDESFRKIKIAIATIVIMIIYESIYIIIRNMKKHKARE